MYADNPDRVIEKGHNDYLTKWVQTGGLSVVCLMALYFFLIKKAGGCMGERFHTANRSHFLGIYRYFPVCLSAMQFHYAPKPLHRLKR